MSDNCHLDYTRNPLYNPFLFHVPYRSGCNLKREKQVNCFLLIYLSYPLQLLFEGLQNCCVSFENSEQLSTKLTNLPCPAKVCRDCPLKCIKVSAKGRVGR